MRSQGVKRTEFDLFCTPMGSFDWEYAGFTGPNIQGALMDPSGEVSFYTDPEDMFYKMIDTPRDKKGNRSSVTYWAHNGEGADFPRMVEAMGKFAEEMGGAAEASVVAQGDTKFIAVIFRIEEGTRHYSVTLADSFAVVPTSLEKLAKIMAPHAVKKGHCPDHDFTNGGPWYSPDCEVCRDYLRGDVEALWYSMYKLRSMLMDDFRVPISLTAGAIALKFWKTTIPEGHTYFRLPADKEGWLTEDGMTAKHGGFVWPGHQRGFRGEAVTYDRSGAYAHQLRQGIPSGLSVWTKTYRPGVPAVWEVTAHVPQDINIPIVAHSGGGPLYPTGTFRARITSLELEYAEKLGCTFDVHRGMMWEKLEYPFEEFVTKCETIEYPADGSDPDPAMKLLIKLMRNGVIGKFGSRPVVERAYLGIDPPPPIPGGKPATPYTDPATGDPLPVWHREEAIEQASHVLPHWNIWVTAQQRIDTHRVLEAGGPGAYYADTDSATLDPETARDLVARGIIDVGIGYGKYHAEGDWAELYTGGPKNKCGWQRVDGEMVWVSTAKGIPRKQRLARGDLQVLAAYGVADEESGMVEWDSSYGLRARLIDPSKGYGQKRRRRFSRLENSSSWVVDGDNNIRPVHMEE